MSLFAELKRRNVIRVAVAYIVATWLLTQVLELAADVFAAPDWVMKLIITGLVVGIVPILIFSWVFELTPEGVKRESEIPHDQSITAHTAKKLDIAVIVLLFAVMGMMGYNQLTGHKEVIGGRVDAPLAQSPTSGSEPTLAEQATAQTGQIAIAVLPFRDMSAAGDQDYFGEGIAEELLNALVTVDGLRVASRTSSFSFKGKDISLPAIASELDVTHILEGSIRSAGNKVRVTAQLIDVSTDAHLWSETFDRTLDDIFAIQDEITGEVVDQLVSYLGETVQPVSTADTLTSNPEAYQFYLKGRHFWRQRNPDSLRTAIDLFNQAVNLDPLFARAWSNLAIAQLNLPSYDYSVDRDSLIARAIAAAERALEIDPKIAEALSVRADALQKSCNWVGAERAYRKAVEADPEDSTTRHWYALMLYATGRSKAALEQARIAYALDPLNAAIVSTLGDTFLLVEDFERTSSLWEDSANLGMDNRNRWLTGYVLAMNGKLDEARKIMLSQPFPFLPDLDSRPISEAFLAALGDEARLPELENRVNQMVADGSLDLFSARMLLMPNNSEAVFPFMVDLCDQGMFYEWTPRATRIRRDPRFFDALEAIGLVDYWREFGWPDRCEDLDPERAECGR